MVAYQPVTWKCRCQLVKSSAFFWQEPNSPVSLIISAFQHSANVSDGCTLDSWLLHGSGKRDVPSVCRDGCRLCSVLYCIADRRLTLWNNMCPLPAGPPSTPAQMINLIQPCVAGLWLNPIMLWCFVAIVRQSNFSLWVSYIICVMKDPMLPSYT